MADYPPTRGEFSTERDAGEEALDEHRGELLVYTIEATAFLRHMVRNLVGTLVEVGKGERSRESVSELLQLRDRKKAGKTAPPHGLYLLEVKY